MARLRLHCRGIVQGVGFRPLVHRLATELRLAGTVENVAGAVLVDLAGRRADLEDFLRRLPAELRPPARLEPLSPLWEPGEAPAPAGPPGVRIAAAAPRPLGTGLVAPALCADRAPCRQCLADLADPADRRHGYPFVSCSTCGPRYSIATAEPYARAHTTLAPFPLCAACRREFDDPADRRFHAETIGCPACGPRLQLWDAQGQAWGGSETAPLLERACALLEDGRILALQGVGGFQLLVDATDAPAVERLRRRKRRPARPFALLVAEAAWIEADALLDGPERTALEEPAAPIVLLRRRFPAVPPRSGSRPGGRPLAIEAVAPGSPALGVMLPASPLHHLLIRAFGRPLVATSGNRSGEPLCTDPAEALARLGGIADAFLVHERAIARPLDDSVLQVIDGRPCLLRRARGYAPEALPLGPGPHPAKGVLALGGDIKAAPALALGDRLWLSPHLGDLADPRQLERLRAGLAEIHGRYGSQLAAVGCDAHPGYLSHQLAHAVAAAPRPVPHHLAHGLAVMAEHRLAPPLLVLACDGLGFSGEDPADTGRNGDGGDPHTRPDEPALRGGELLWIGEHGERRLACLRPFPLPGGERAMDEPRRAALGLLLAADPCGCHGLLDHPGARHTRAAFRDGEVALLRQAVASGCNAPLTSSLGRLFDAAASLLGLVQVLSYEGEGGLRLQGAAARACAAGPAGGEPAGEREPQGPWPMAAVAPPPPGGLPMGKLDWGPQLTALLEERAAGVPPGSSALRFHHGVAIGLAELAAWAALQGYGRQVALAGGCFQNRLLLELTIAALRQRGLAPFWGEAVPVNDGGLAVGQVLALRRGASGTAACVAGLAVGGARPRPA